VSGGYLRTIGGRRQRGTGAAARAAGEGPGGRRPPARRRRPEARPQPATSTPGARGGGPSAAAPGGALASGGGVTGGGRRGGARAGGVPAGGARRRRRRGEERRSPRSRNTGGARVPRRHEAGAGGGGRRGTGGGQRGGAPCAAERAWGSRGGGGPAWRFRQRGSGTLCRPPMRGSWRGLRSARVGPDRSAAPPKQLHRGGTDGEWRHVCKRHDEQPGQGKTSQQFGVVFNQATNRATYAEVMSGSGVLGRGPGRPRSRFNPAQQVPRRHAGDGPGTLARRPPGPACGQTSPTTWPPLALQPDRAALRRVGVFFREGGALGFALSWAAAPVNPDGRNSYTGGTRRVGRHADEAGSTSLAGQTSSTTHMSCSARAGTGAL